MKTCTCASSIFKPINKATALGDAARIVGFVSLSLPAMHAEGQPSEDVIMGISVCLDHARNLISYAAESDAGGGRDE